MVLHFGQSLKTSKSWHSKLFSSKTCIEIYSSEFIEGNSEIILRDILQKSVNSKMQYFWANKKIMIFQIWKLELSINIHIKARSILSGFNLNPGIKSLFSKTNRLHEGVKFCKKNSIQTVADKFFFWIFRWNVPKKRFS